MLLLSDYYVFLCVFVGIKKALGKPESKVYIFYIVVVFLIVGYFENNVSVVHVIVNRKCEEKTV